METRLLVLKLILDEMGVDAGIERLEDRKRVQKAVYLGQRLGVDLGYRYNWYRLGPYSPKLAKDYYELDMASSVEDDPAGGEALHKTVIDALQPFRALAVPPADSGLKEEDWLELMASVDYLQTVEGMRVEGARDRIGTEKKHLAAHFDDALCALKAAKLSQCK